MVKAALISLVLLIAQLHPQDDDALLKKLAVEFDGKYGQVEIGGYFVGAEFHHSRPLPSRISFYYPAANSIDLSSDYWQRDESQPFVMQLNFDGQAQQIGKDPWRYRYTPFHAEFRHSTPAYRISIRYHFCKDLPAMVVEIGVTNLQEKANEVELSTLLNTNLRTSHTYAIRNEAKQYYLREGLAAVAEFDYVDTDSTWIFVANAGELPLNQSSNEAFPEAVENPSVSFQYKKILEPKGDLSVIQLIGSCRSKEGEMLITRLMEEWKEDYTIYEQSVLHKAFEASAFRIGDPAFEQTLHWSRAMLESNKHYLDGKIIPMPCPAEYNFFFTHDLLLTDLGAVFYDAERVRNDLFYLKSLSQGDGVLPHAYYWKDGAYRTEFCGSDNWNHLWFIILTASYLRHTNDHEAVLSMLPMLEKSLELLLQNKGADDLMYAMRPDWWDIGNVYGARAYITSLMIRTLRDYVFICVRLDRSVNEGSAYLDLADRMKQALQEYLWSRESGYLLNMVNEQELDRHYYAGSLIAAALGIIDADKTSRMLETARRQLLDRNIGVRIVMPADFHKLIDKYQFNGMEMGEPYQYINGGVWPQSIVWYALGWLSIHQPDSAEKILREYYTLMGIESSSHGQPSFFEYRNADANSPLYGKIDKPTFLWAAGWFIHSLYRLAGIRENEWNISFDSRLPSGWEQVEYEILINGSLAQVHYRGKGVYFKKIEVDGANSFSAVFNAPVASLVFERGIPKAPYLAEATCHIREVSYDSLNGKFDVTVKGLIGQTIQLKIVSPIEPGGPNQSALATAETRRVERENGVWIIEYHHLLSRLDETIQIQF